jgi:hypothetical protein
VKAQYRNPKNQKNNEDKEVKDSPKQSNNSQNQEKPYSFEQEQKRKILDDLLRKEAETKRRIEQKQSTPYTNVKNW